LLVISSNSFRSSGGNVTPTRTIFVIGVTDKSWFICLKAFILAW
jgi:hypothetical protein